MEDIPPVKAKPKFNKEEDFLYIVEELAYSHFPVEDIPLPKDRTEKDYASDRVEIWLILRQYHDDGGKIDRFYECYPDLIKHKPELAGYRALLGQLWDTPGELLKQIADAYEEHERVPIVRRSNTIQDGDSYDDLKSSLEQKRVKAWNDFHRLLMKVWQQEP
ncbi:MAG: hypothetical protein HQL69_18525 [Magnetococcales bacterium]|nr:hypothetical protein [Magnetococcales bacterium]